VGRSATRAEARATLAAPERVRSAYTKDYYMSESLLRVITREDEQRCVEISAGGGAAFDIEDHDTYDPQRPSGKAARNTRTRNNALAGDGAHQANEALEGRG
jgi:hypothetical protein